MPREWLDLRPSVASRTPGAARSLRRLEVFLDIAYALVTVHMLTYLPAVRDMSWVHRPLGLLGAMIGNGRELWRALMGLTISAIAWLVCARRLSRLAATDAVHSGIVLVQTGLACFFVYFAICDPLLTGGPSSRALQCGCLALASASGQLGWFYARRRGLVDPATPARELDEISTRGRTETLSALLIVPLSWIGPVTWTAGWVLVPAALMLAFPQLRVRGAEPAGDGG